MATDARNKEIQVQKPAQSLEHFQAKVASGADLETGLLNQVLLGLGVVALLGLGWIGVDAMRTKAVERHESALAELLLKVEGDGATPPPAAELEKRMRENLATLQGLAASAPGSRKAITEGLLASWKLQLEGKGAAPAMQNDPWSRLREAQRLLDKGDAAAASAALDPLRKDATPQAPWGNLWWLTRLDVDRLKGDRPQALRDAADYKERFKQEADAATVERTLNSL